MNPNNNPEAQFSAQIDQLLSGNTSTGIPAADDLARTIPAASPIFQGTLEDRLVAQLQGLPFHEGAHSMTATSSISTGLTIGRLRTYIPLTLAAAILALVVVGSVLLTRGSRQELNLNVVLQTTSTPTPEPVANVLVVNQDLPRGYIFPSDVTELASLVRYITLPESLIPPDSLREDQDGMAQVAGKILRVNLNREQPVLAGQLAVSVVALQDFTPSEMLLPFDKIAMSLSVRLEEILASGLQNGDFIDVVVSLNYASVGDSPELASPGGTFQTVNPPPPDFQVNPDSDCTTDDACLVTQTVLQAKPILDIRPLADETDTVTVTLALTADELSIMTWIVNADLPYILRRTINLPPQLPSYPGVIPVGMVLAHIPFDSISTDLSFIHEGDLVDVKFSFLREAVEPQDTNTVLPDNGHIDTRTVLSAVKVYKVGDGIVPSQKNVVTLLLNKPDGALLSALMKGNTPIAITLTTVNTNPVLFKALPDGRVSIDIQASVTGDEGLSDMANVLAQLYFTNYNPENLNSVGLEGKHLVTQVLVRDAEIIGRPDEETYTVAVAPEDREILQWAITSGLEFALQNPSE